MTIRGPKSQVSQYPIPLDLFEAGREYWPQDTAVHRPLFEEAAAVVVAVEATILDLQILLHSYLAQRFDTKKKRPVPLKRLQPRRT